MQAVILAGGLATRMRPRTLTIPKSLLPVKGRPFIDWQLEKIVQCGYQRVLLCIGHLGSQIRKRVGNGSGYGLTVGYSEDGPKLLGTAGALRQALDQLDSTFLVTYGDSYLPFDYAKPLVDLRAHPEAGGTMSVFKNQGRWDASNTEVRGEWVIRYDKGVTDPSLDHIDYGAVALRRDIVQALPAGQRCELASVQTELAQSGQMRAVLAQERFFEIGSPDGLSDLEQRLQFSSERSEGIS